MELFEPGSKSSSPKSGNLAKSRNAHHAILEAQEVQYVEVPYTQEVTKYVPKKVIVDVEKHVPILEVEWVDREVKVPQIQYKEKIVFTEHIKEVVKQVKEKIIIEVPVQKLREIPKIEKREIVKNVIVEGEEIDIPLPYLVHKNIVVPRYLSIPEPTVVAQTLRVSIGESKTEVVDIVLNEYIPKFVHSEVFVPMQISSKEGRILVPVDFSTRHLPIDYSGIPSAQWNSLVKDSNSHIFKNDRAKTAASSFLQDLLHTCTDNEPRLRGIGAYNVSPVNIDWFQEQGNERQKHDNLLEHLSTISSK